MPVEKREGGSSETLLTFGVVSRPASVFVSVRLPVAPVGEVMVTAGAVGDEGVVVVITGLRDPGFKSVALGGTMTPRRPAD